MGVSNILSPDAYRIYRIIEDTKYTISQFCPGLELEYDFVAGMRTGFRLNGVRLKKGERIEKYLRFTFSEKDESGLDENAALLIFVVEEFVLDKLEDQNRVAYSYSGNAKRLEKILRKLGWLDDGKEKEIYTPGVNGSVPKG